MVDDSEKLFLITVQNISLLDSIQRDGFVLADPPSGTAEFYASNAGAANPKTWSNWYCWMSENYGQRCEVPAVFDPLAGKLFWAFRGNQVDKLSKLMGEHARETTKFGKPEHALLFLRVPRSRVLLSNFENWDSVIDEWPPSKTAAHHVFGPFSDDELLNQAVLASIEIEDLIGYFRFQPT